MVNTTTGVRDRPAIISLVSYSYSTVDTEHVSGAERKESQSNLYLCIHRYRKWYWTLGFLEVRGRLLLNIMNNRGKCPCFVTVLYQDLLSINFRVAYHTQESEHFPYIWYRESEYTFRGMVRGKWAHSGIWYAESEIWAWGTVNSWKNQGSKNFMRESL